LTSLISSGERQAVPLALSVYRRVDQSSLRHRVEWDERSKKKRDSMGGKLVSPAKEQPPADMAVRFRV
jgi:hypothetical protein